MAKEKVPDLIMMDLMPSLVNPVKMPSAYLVL